MPHRSLIAVTCLVVAAGAAPATAQFDLLVGSWATHSVRKYNPMSGEYLGDLIPPGTAGLSTPDGFDDRDGILYVASSDTDQILTYDLATGAFLEVWATAELDGPGNLQFGPDGLLYVCNKLRSRVDRFDPATGHFMGAFAEGGGLLQPVGMAWDQGVLYVADFNGNAIRKYDAMTGAPLGDFVSIATPLILRIEGGEILATSHQLSSLTRFDLATAAVTGTLSGNGTNCPVGHLIGPGGDTILASWASNRILRFDPSGTFVNIFAIGGGLALPNDLLLVETPCLADCDQSTGPGSLDIFDFLCFQDRFVNSDPRACACDTSTGLGVCDIFDFLCFQDAFASGCP